MMYLISTYYDNNNTKRALFQMSDDDERFSKVEVIGKITDYGKKKTSEFNGYQSRDIIVNGEKYELFSADWSARKL